MTDETKKQIPHPDLGEVGEIGDVGDLGSNAIDHPARQAQAEAAALDAVAAEEKVRQATASDDEKVSAIAEKLEAAGYAPEQARAMARSAIDNLKGAQS